jgi:hypothetical protein
VGVVPVRRRENIRICGTDPIMETGAIRHPAAVQRLE